MLVRNYQDVAPIPTDRESVQKRVVIGPRQGAPNFVMRIIDVAAGASPPPHSHDWEHEVLVLNGEALLMGEKEQTPVKAGDAIYIPPNEKHGWVIKGNSTFRFVCVVPTRGEDTP